MVDEQDNPAPCGLGAVGTEFRVQLEAADGAELTQGIVERLHIQECAGMALYGDFGWEQLANNEGFAKIPGVPALSSLAHGYIYSGEWCDRGVCYWADACAWNDCDLPYTTLQMLTAVGCCIGRSRRQSRSKKQKAQSSSCWGSGRHAR